MESFKTFNDYLDFYSRVSSNKRALTFLGDGENESICLPYNMLQRRAMAIAACLQEDNLKSSRAVLLYGPGTEFIAAFFGCLCAGVIAIPAYPPRRNGSVEHINSIVLDAKPSFLLTDSKTYSMLTSNKYFSELDCKMRWIVTEDIGDEYSLNYQAPKITPESIAFLQYTSGSTSKPKGVMVTHSNILHNQEMIYESFQHSPNMVTVSWLPLYHDMGLIGSILQPIFSGGSCIFFPPAYFLQNPFCWLKAISKYKATTAGAPNFGYDLCVEKINEAEVHALDLSSWTVAFNGSEPVRADTLKSFTKKFAPAGFNGSSFYPCYGMAEATLLVSGGIKGCRPVTTYFDSEALKQNRAEVINQVPPGVEARNLVSCGGTWGDQEIIIANPETKGIQWPGHVGEIWLKGSNIASGYWNQPGLTEERFNAFLTDTGDGPFFRTGDLGFFS